MATKAAPIIIPFNEVPSNGRETGGLIELILGELLKLGFSYMLFAPKSNEIGSGTPNGSKEAVAAPNFEVGLNDKWSHL